MLVKELPNYGKDVLTVQAQSRRFHPKRWGAYLMVLSQYIRLVWELGLMRAFEFWGRLRAERARARTLNWSRLTMAGLKEADLNKILKRITFAKVLMETNGVKDAERWHRGLAHAAAYASLEDVFGPSQTLMECGGGDFLPAFKEYSLALVEAMDRSGLVSGKAIKDTPDAFQVNVTRCAWAEAARTLGNARACQFSACYAEEVFFLRYCSKAGFEFYRAGSLASGSKVCDQRFARFEG